MKLQRSPLPRLGPGPLAVLAGAGTLALGLLALEIGSENHRRAMDLHHLQKRASALEAINLELAAEVDAHVPGRLDSGDPLESREREVTGVPPSAGSVPGSSAP